MRAAHTSLTIPALALVFAACMSSSNEDMASGSVVPNATTANAADTGLPASSSTPGAATSSPGSVTITGEQPSVSNPGTIASNSEGGSAGGDATAADETVDIPPSDDERLGSAEPGAPVPGPDTSEGATAAGGTTGEDAVASGGASGEEDVLGLGGSGVGGASDSPAAPVDGANTDPTFHVFLLLGQSNMAGYPKAQEADRVEDPRVTVLGFDECAATGRVTDEWDVAAPPLHECWNDAIGIGDYFAKTLVDVIPEGDTIGLVPCAISGERIETFMKVGGSRYDWILRRARLAQDAGGVIQGLLFHQGESNSGDSSWPGKVNEFVSDLRADLGIGEVPFLAGELLYSGGTSGHNTQVNRLPDVVSNAYVVSAEGLVVDPTDTQWMLHFDHDSEVTFGVRYAETMMSALGW